MPYFFRDRLKIFYRDQGKGTPLLFIHGAFGSRHLWKEQAKFFATRFRVITFDVRGHGSSSKLRKGYELEKIVEDIVALLDYLKIRRSVVIGSSMGGVLALMIGFMHRSRVRALILVGTLAKAIWLGHAEQFIRKIQKRGPDKGVMEWFAPKADKRNIDVALHESRKTSRHFGVEVVLANYGWDIREGLPRIRAPTLIVVGKEDKKTTPLSESREIHSLIKDSEMTIVQGAGHLVMLEKPDVFNNLMLSYLERKRI